MKEERPMKILAFSDVHGDQGLISRMTQLAKEADLVLIGGDFAPRHDVDTVPDNLVGPFLDLGKKVYIIHGNNETESSVDFIKQRYKINDLHGNAFSHYDIGFFGAGGADIGPFPTDDEEIFQKLKESHEKIKDKKTKIMVTHAHPSDSAMHELSPWVQGSPAVRRAIKEFEPDIVFCGHVHEGSGAEEQIGKTKVINVACTGKVIEVKK